MTESQISGQRLIEWLLQVRTADPLRQRRGRLTAIILLVIGALATLALVISVWVVVRPGDRPRSMLIDQLAVGLVLLVVVYLLNRRGYTLVAGVGFALVTLGFDLALLYTRGPLTPEAVSLAVPVLLAGLLGPPVSAIGVALLAAAAYVVVCTLGIPSYFEQIFFGGPAVQTILVYFNLAFVALVSWLFARTTNRALIESHELSLALVAQREDLEHKLEAQTRHLRATITVARAVAGARDLDNLLTDIVTTVREYFGYYHVQIFLVDEDGRYATLRQSTGDAGRRLLARGHRLPVGSMSVIGQVTSTARPVVARDTDADAVHRANELLPRTRSEMALPLVVGEQVIGALDVQSIEVDAFDPDTVPALQSMADQLSIAIENARLYEEAQQNLRELAELSQEITQRSWADFLATAPDAEIRVATGREDAALAAQRKTVIERVLATGAVMASGGDDDRPTYLAAPIVVRNQVIGVLGVEPEGPRAWTHDDLLLIQGVAERTALAVENARLYIQARRAAEREHLISSIAERLQRAPSLEMLLESAAAELSSALGTEQVYAELSLAEHDVGRGEEGDEEEDAALP